MKKVHIVLIVFCATVSTIIIALYWMAAAKEARAHQTPTTPPNARMTLYYGETCPHCRIVEEWLDEHDPENSLQVDRKEAYNDRANTARLIGAAAQCGITGDSVGVPFLVLEGQCFIGDEPIIVALGQRMEAMG